MSKFVINLEEQSESVTAAPKVESIPQFGDYQKPKKRRIFVKILGVLAGITILLLIVGSIAAFFYWQHLKTTPQYSLALLIDAARRDDQKAIDELVDMDSVVDDFIPQITDKAVELYGKGLPPRIIDKIAQAVAPQLPAVKQLAREEVPKVIREKTEKFESIPFWAIALAADRYLEISPDGDRAIVTSKIQDRPLELTLKKNGDKWQVVGLKDEALAKRIAEKIGQQIIALTTKNGAKKPGENLKIEGLNDILEQLKDILKK